MDQLYLIKYLMKIYNDIEIVSILVYFFQYILCNDLIKIEENLNRSEYSISDE